MADVTGPIATMPGAVYATPDGAVCDDCGAPATRRIQGETDSFGAEMYDLCDACAKNCKPGQLHLQKGRCDWCKKPAKDRMPQRDYEEGTSGPVYLVCGKCRARYRREMDEEDERLGLFDYEEELDD